MVMDRSAKKTDQGISSNDSESFASDASVRGECPRDASLLCFMRQSVAICRASAIGWLTIWRPQDFLAATSAPAAQTQSSRR